MVHASGTSRVAQAVAWAGGLLFVGSLLFFAACYTRLWDADPTTWSPAGAPAAAIDGLLFSVFALHHTVFARLGVKRLITRLVPAPLERSAYVWAASLLFIAICAWWRPVPGALWRMHGPARMAMFAGQALAGAMAVLGARRLDVLELAGIRQVIGTPVPALDTSGLYGFVRHPIYLAWVLLVWLAPEMNGARFVFALVSCGYLFLAVPFEERDLGRTFGDAYDAYRRRVRWRILPGLY
jgi:methanethiol S-methyltransferase